MRQPYSIVFSLIFTLLVQEASAQLMYMPEEIYSPYVLKDEKAVWRRQRLIQQANSLNRLHPDTAEGEILTALWAAGQFLVRTPESDSGVTRLMARFSTLSSAVQRNLMELVYGLYPTQFETAAARMLSTTTHPKVFAQAAAYLHRLNPKWVPRILQQMNGRFAGAADLMDALKFYLNQPAAQTPIPDLDSLFRHQQVHGFKVVYSFQRQNRDYPGLAVVQQPDGCFARDSSGKLKSFVQLARSASNLPWFLTNGSTPQGLYAIRGTDVSKNVFIGPTPNLQMVMMHEVNPPQFTHYMPLVFNAPPEKIYRSYFPESWQHWNGLMEAYQAGKIGRGEIIAHGTTIQPDWFEGKSFFPISPTLGCLCGREIWDEKTGKIVKSDQLDLVNTFLETPGTKGYLIVINLDNAEKAVSPEEVEQLIRSFECNNTDRSEGL